MSIILSANLKAVEKILLMLFLELVFHRDSIYEQLPANGIHFDCRCLGRRNKTKSLILVLNLLSIMAAFLAVMRVSNLKNAVNSRN